ncbi:hypothetical protein [Tumebacillus sp. BK434]|uniref:hypothetical protein n=1 Tax=Tumebacillus sp. BK434 TaxID=2512169 RepID=UPI00104CAB53|nr:hypothetical protein [Tumebacillus sp. BK434]
MKENKEVQLDASENHHRTAIHHPFMHSVGHSGFVGAAIGGEFVYVVFFQSVSARHSAISADRPDCFPKTCHVTACQLLLPVVLYVLAAVPAIVIFMLVVAWEAPWGERLEGFGFFLLYGAAGSLLFYHVSLLTLAGAKLFSRPRL